MGTYAVKEKIPNLIFSPAKKEDEHVSWITLYIILNKHLYYLNTNILD